jgi:hypothetical protein
MRPPIILFLCSLGLSLQGIVPWMMHEHKPLPLLSVLFVVIAFALLRKNKAAFRTFQAAIWIIFILSLLAALMVVYGTKSEFTFLDGVTIHSSKSGAILYFAVWLIAFGAVLYYMESDKVRKEFGIPPKKVRSNTF